MRHLSLTPRHRVDQQSRRGVDDEGNYEQYQPQLDQRVAVDFGRGLCEFVGDGRSDGEGWLEQRCGYLGPVAYDHRDRHGFAHGATQAQYDGAGDARFRVLQNYT